jgi:hypothetical protein
LPSTNDAPDHPSDPGPTPAASSSAPILGVGQGTQSAFVSPNLIYPVRCPTDGVHFTEGFNSKIQAIKADTRGFRRFANRGNAAMPKSNNGHPDPLAGPFSVLSMVLA